MPLTMTRIPSSPMIVAVVLAALGGMAIAQDKYSVQVPDGLAFSDFRGYEDWQVVSVAMVDPTGPAMSSESGAVLNLIVANPAMIDAYRNGVPDNGRKFPDGSKIAKMQWIPKKSAEAPFSVNVPEILRMRRTATDFGTVADGDMPTSTMTLQ